LLLFKVFKLLQLIEEVGFFVGVAGLGLRSLGFELLKCLLDRVGVGVWFGLLLWSEVLEGVVVDRWGVGGDWVGLMLGFNLF
jgi:hypothetical protein